MYTLENIPCSGQNGLSLLDLKEKNDKIMLFCSLCYIIYHYFLYYIRGFLSLSETHSQFLIRLQHQWLIEPGTFEWEGSRVSKGMSNLSRVSDDGCFGDFSTYNRSINLLHDYKWDTKFTIVFITRANSATSRFSVAAARRLYTFYVT